MDRALDSRLKGATVPGSTPGRSAPANNLGKLFTQVLPSSCQQFLNFGIAGFRFLLCVFISPDLIFRVFSTLA